MPLVFGLRMVAEALERRRRDETRQEWLAMLPWMSKDNYVSFEEFYRERVAPVAAGPRRSKDEILAEAQRIREAAAQQTA